MKNSRLMSQTIFALVILAALNLPTPLVADDNILARTAVGYIGPVGILGDYDYGRVGLRIYDSNKTGEWVIGPLTVADIGNTFWANPSTANNYPVCNFDDMTDLLTDGLPGPLGWGDFIDLTVGIYPNFGGGGIAETEYTVFQNNALFNYRVNTQLFFQPINSFDLQGATISSISLRIDDYSLVKQDDQTLVGAAYTMEYWGTANASPEPSTVLLLGTGLGGLAFAAWRRKKR